MHIHLLSPNLYFKFLLESDEAQLDILFRLGLSVNWLIAYKSIIFGDSTTY